MKKVMYLALFLASQSVFACDGDVVFTLPKVTSADDFLASLEKGKSVQPAGYDLESIMKTKASLKLIKVCHKQEGKKVCHNVRSF
ncbi:hypothetical protein EXU30_15205 [Shewanella maritima]|uniref:Uncharacterized protein n=1 Tax=Shewanella maritima TaxID=2520507 RepID=A0A411PJY8_9GAMM|nr:hypothetical protein [Shewanella maritima]QBF83875.1 hypothetical protein EXU30_15205 [Shewanella maritima]